MQVAFSGVSVRVRVHAALDFTGLPAMLGGFASRVSPEMVLGQKCLYLGYENCDKKGAISSAFGVRQL